MGARDLGVATLAVLAVACRPRPEPAGTPMVALERTSASVVPDSPESKEPDVGAAIDQELRRRWDEAGVVVAPAVDDEGFLRRSTLHLVGRVPTPEERSTYLRWPQDVRRARWVDTLLTSEDYAEYQSWRVQDLLFDESARQAPRLIGPARIWLREQIRRNRPWDEVVFELLTATGELEYQAQTSFIIGHLKTTGLEGLTATVGDRFLGVQLACAQCHDHPFADWTQREFWGLAAGLAGAKVRAQPQERFNRLFLEESDKPRVVHIASGSAGAKTVAKPELLGRPVEPNDEQESVRAATARMIIESELFAKAAVSRLWLDLVGRSLHEPWNDLGPDDQEHDPVLEMLAEAFVASGFDLAALTRTIVLCEAYQRSSSGPSKGREEAERAFARASIRPLDAKQVYDSVLSITGLHDLSEEGFRMQVTHRRDQLERTYQDLFNDGCTRATREAELELAQRLTLLNDGLLHYGALARQGSALARLLDAHPDPVDRVEAIYVRVLARVPTAIERERALEVVTGTEGTEGYEDLMFALLNSAEFLTNH